jgi:cytochrome c oxidase subunit IV
MHVMWERMALITLILGPPTVLLVLIGMMTSESDYMFDTRVDHLGQPEAAQRIHVSDVHQEAAE